MILNFNFKKIFFSTFFIIIFYKAFIKFRNMFNQLKVIYRQPLWHCPAMCIIYVLIFNIWRFFIFIIIFNVFVISFCISMNSMTFLVWYLFLVLEPYQYLLKDLWCDFGLRLLAMLILDLKEIFQDQVYIF